MSLPDDYPPLKSFMMVQMSDTGKLPPSIESYQTLPYQTFNSNTIIDQFLPSRINYYPNDFNLQSSQRFESHNQMLQNSKNVTNYNNIHSSFSNNSNLSINQLQHSKNIASVVSKDSYIVPNFSIYQSPHNQVVQKTAQNLVSKSSNHGFNNGIAPNFSNNKQCNIMSYNYHHNLNNAIQTIDMRDLSKNTITSQYSSCSSNSQKQYINTLEGQSRFKNNNTYNHINSSTNNHKAKYLNEEQINYSKFIQNCQYLKKPFIQNSKYMTNNEKMNNVDNFTSVNSKHLPANKNIQTHSHMQIPIVTTTPNLINSLNNLPNLSHNTSVNFNKMCNNLNKESLSSQSTLDNMTMLQQDKMLLNCDSVNQKKRKIKTDHQPTKIKRSYTKRKTLNDISKISFHSQSFSDKEICQIEPSFRLSEEVLIKSNNLEHLAKQKEILNVLKKPKIKVLEEKTELDVQISELDCIKKYNIFKNSGIKIDDLSKHLAHKTSAIKRCSSNPVNKVFLQMEACSSLAPNICRCCECRKNEKTEASGCRFYSFRKLINYSEHCSRPAGYPLPIEAASDDVLLWMAEADLIHDDLLDPILSTPIPEEVNGEILRDTELSTEKSDISSMEAQICLSASIEEVVTTSVDKTVKQLRSKKDKRKNRGSLQAEEVKEPVMLLGSLKQQKKISWIERVAIAKYVLANIGSQFCHLVEQEKSASVKKGIVWRRSLDGVREMCDECRTTIFNMHWTCLSCGFIVCIDCYLNANKSACPKPWPKCDVLRTDHLLSELTPTQILPSDVLLALDKAMHEVEKDLTLRLTCNCSTNESTNATSSKNLKSYSSKRSLNSQHRKKISGKFRRSRDYNLKTEESAVCFDPVNYNKEPIRSALTVNRHDPFNRGPLSISVLRQVFKKFAHVPHAWLDNGRLLQLTSPWNSENIEPFQHLWKLGQPVIISNCQERFDMKLWHPHSFISEFGQLPNDLVNCGTGTIIEGWTMSVFWNGFEKVKRRKKDNNGEPMILKLKDWPSTADFSDILPSRFANLMHALPLPEYSGRDGVFNLASRLPEHYVRPDLGPKMYCAFGTALNQKIGSTNLHLDISDAVNLLIYVGVPKDDVQDHEEAAFNAMVNAGCCESTLERVKNGAVPGALWHIYDAKDSYSIRTLLRTVAEENGEVVEENSDPIHDQCWYLNEELRKRLLTEYNVLGYSIVQCIGDAVFIPAGAPHQVQNFHSCIKAAEDFVSPENLDYCFHLTQEFRNLSDTHSNHEDKLQVKNILYHSVKEAVAVIKKHSQISKVEAA